MSQSDAAFNDLDQAVFDTFGEDATVQRGTDAAVPVRVVVTRGVAKVGDYGQVVARVTTVLFRNTEWQPQQGDTLTLAVDGARRVASIDDDDGRVTTAVLHG